LHVPEFPCWPCPKGYSIVLNFKLENHSMKQNSEPHFFSFLDKDGRGLRLFLKNRNSGKMQLYVQIQPDEEWQFLVIVHQYVKLGQDDNFQIYLNGNPRWRGSVAYPNVRNALPFCFIGNADEICLESRYVRAAKSPDSSRYAFRGRISTFSLLNCALTQGAKKVSVAY